MEYFLGLDNGGTMTKAGIYDRNGTEICVSSMATAMITPAPGYIERDMEEMWEANCTVIRTVLKKSGIAPKDIRGAAVCGHGKGLYLWGKDGQPVRNGIISTDNRAWRYPVKWAADGTEDQVFARSCQHILACQPVSLLAWLRDHEPECFDRIQWIFEAKDYIRFRLTGEARAELTDYSGANLINLHTRQYDRELLKLFGLTDCERLLPPLCQTSQICGHVTAEAAALCGLLEGTPVAGGMFDLDACMLAVDVTNERNICMIAGTWAVNLYLNRTPVTDKSIMMNTIFSLPEYYLAEECSPTSAGNNEWFIKALLPEAKKEAKESGKSIYETVNQWVAKIPETEICPVFLPFLMGSNAHPNAKGSFVGISNVHTRKHLARAVYEGITFSHKFHLMRLLKSYPGKPEVIRLAGGAARSRVWAQMFADVMELPVETVNVNETGTLGCAIAAAAATGLYPDLLKAAEHMCGASSRLEPEKNRFPVYRKKYDFYQKTVKALDTIWEDYQQLIGGS